MPGNWINLPLIRAALPNARIIDARRHPMACGFSNFKQNYAIGVGFAYSQDTIGTFYRDYWRFMRHFDEVEPGGVHRLVNERLIEDPEGEVRRLLDFARPAVRSRLPRIPQERARGAHAERRTGAQADQPRRRGLLAPLRAVARRTQGVARPRARALGRLSALRRPCASALTIQLKRKGRDGLPSRPSCLRQARALLAAFAALDRRRRGRRRRRRTGHPSPRSPIRPGTSASPEPAEAAGAEEAAAAAAAASAPKL